ERVRRDREIRPAPCWPQVAVEDAEAAGPALGDGHEPAPLVGLAGQVVGERDADRLRSMHEGLGENVLLGETSERECTLRAPREGRLDGLPAPARGSARGRTAR